MGCRIHFRVYQLVAKITFMRGYKLLFILLLISTWATGQEDNGWLPLFNGRNFEGWKQSGRENLFDIENGEIVASINEGVAFSYLVTDKTYSDFVLEFELLIDNELTGGIFFGSTVHGADVKGYQHKLYPQSPIWNNGIYDGAGKRWLYTQALAQQGKTAYKMGEWNLYRIECIGNRIRTWVNNKPVAYIIDQNNISGHIVLQIDPVHTNEAKGKQIRWRNIKIKTQQLDPVLSADTYVVNRVPNTLSGPEEEQGWKLLFDGKSTRGWVNVYNPSAFPDEGWIVEDGMICAVPNRPGARVKGTDIVSTEKFKAFDLQFEFSYAEGANSGVKYALGNGGPAVGLEYQILDDKRHPDANGGKLGNRRLSSLYDLIPADRLGELTNGPGNWNYGRIVVSPDNRVEHWLNGVKVVEYERGSGIYHVLVAHSKYAEFEGFGIVEESPVLLQYHQDEVKFRSIKIKKL